MRFEEDLILNQPEIENENIDELVEEIESVDEEYYNQLYGDLINEILIEMKIYCESQRLFLCEKLKREDIEYLLN